MNLLYVNFLNSNADLPTKDNFPKVVLLYTFNLHVKLKKNKLLRETQKFLLTFDVPHISSSIITQTQSPLNRAQNMPLKGKKISLTFYVLHISSTIKTQPQSQYSPRVVKKNSRLLFMRFIGAGKTGKNGVEHAGHIVVLLCNFSLHVRG
jgi:hypothetical protein